VSVPPRLPQGEKGKGQEDLGVGYVGEERVTCVGRGTGYVISSFRHYSTLSRKGAWQKKGPPRTSFCWHAGT